MMMTFDDFMIERKLDEWLNSEEDIFERSYNSYRSGGGFLGWLKRLGEKFWNWLTGKKYDKDDWYWDDKSRGFYLEPNDYNKFFRTNPNLQNKFPYSYELSQNDDYDEISAVPVMNGNKGFPACISFTDEGDDVITFLRKVSNNKKWHKDLEKWVEENFKDEDTVFIINIEFAIDATWKGCEGVTFKVIYDSVTEKGNEYEKICVYVDNSPMMKGLFGQFMNNNLSELAYDNNHKAIIFPTESLKKFKNATPPPIPKTPQEPEKQDDEDTSQEPEKRDKKATDKTEGEKERKKEKQILTGHENISINDNDGNKLAEVLYYDPKEVAEIFKDKTGDKYRTLTKDYHGFKPEIDKNNDVYIVYDIISNNKDNKLNFDVVKFTLHKIAEFFAKQQSAKDTRIYFLISKNKPEFETIKKQVAQDDLKIKRYEFDGTNVAIKRYSLESAKNGASETNQIRFYFIAATPKKETETNESYTSLTSYFKKIQINEALDENIFYLLDTWFYNRDDEKDAFMSLITDCINKKTYNKKDIEELCNQYNIEVAPLVNFINQEIDITPKNGEVDYAYNMKQIIDAIVGNKSKSNTYVKNTYDIK